MHHEALTKEGARLFRRLTAFSDFYLAGGTALALQIGHRVSIDFDFFSDELIPSSLLSKVKRVFGGTAIHVLINNPEQLTVVVDAVKLTFLYYPFPLVELLVPLDGLQLMSIREIGVTKAYSIGRRGTFKDYVDLFFILGEGHIALEELTAAAEQKFGGEFNSRLFLEQLLFMDDLGDHQIEFLHTAVTAPEILTFFQQEIEHLARDR